MKDHHCRHLLGSLSDYVDGVLEEQLCAEIERHLTGCENCRVVVDTLNKTVSLYRLSAAQSAADSGVRQRLFKRLDLEEFLGKNEDSL
jgi:anti-sigma factor RsiW